MGNKYRNSITIGVLSTVVSVSLIGCSSPQATLMNGKLITVVQGEQVTDSLGTYARLKLEANSPVYNFPFSPQTLIDKTSIEANGFTEADAAAAQKAAAEFVATEMVDNASIDTPETFATTLQADASKYFIGSYIPIMTDPNQSTIIYKTADGVTFMRDGKTRIANNELSVIGIEGSSLLDGTKTIAVNGQTETTYRLSKESTATNNGKNSVTIISSWGLYMLPDENGNWKIAGYQTNFETRQ